VASEKSSPTVGIVTKLGVGNNLVRIFTTLVYEIVGDKTIFILL
jgi:hypothetical protein